MIIYIQGLVNQVGIGDPYVVAVTIQELAVCGVDIGDDVSKQNNDIKN